MAVTGMPQKEVAGMPLGRRWAAAPGCYWAVTEMTLGRRAWNVAGLILLGWCRWDDDAGAMSPGYGARVNFL